MERNKIMDGIDPLLSLVIRKIDDLIINHGSDAWDMVLMLTRLEGLMVIGTGWLSFAIAAGLFIYKSKEDEHDFRDDRDVFGILGILFVIVGFGFNMALWQWVAIFAPEVKIASDILWKVL